MSGYEFSPACIPFSAPGSWMVFSILGPEHDKRIGGEWLFLRSARNGGAVCRLLLVRDGVELPFTATGEPSRLCLSAGDAGEAEIVFDGDDTLRIRSRGVAVALTGVEGFTGICQVNPMGAEWFRAIYFAGSTNLFYHFRLLEGCWKFEGEWSGTGHRVFRLAGLPAEGGRAEFVIRESRREGPFPVPLRPFDEAEADRRHSFEAFLAGYTLVPGFAERQRDAAYLNWSFFVSPAGNVRRRAMLVSKLWMCGIWAWDHCFNAIALAAAHPESAFDQFMVMFDLADEQGGMPDKINEEVSIRVYAKPPVHGWTYRTMMCENPAFFADPERLIVVYERLRAWTGYWLEARDPYHVLLPLYYHGNDSGLDNSTWFLNPPPFSSPELIADLIIQLDLLSELAGRLGRSGESASWREYAGKLLEKLTGEFWDGEGFHAVSPTGGRLPLHGDPIIPYMVLVLGTRLPVAVRDRLIADLREPGRFLTPCGLASENPQSEFYQPDGYWRGPVWAPPTMLIASGLWECGENALADEIALRYCRLCVNSGLAENFDALDGRGYRDRTLSWTASVFLYLVEKLRRRGRI